MFVADRCDTAAVVWTPAQAVSVYRALERAAHFPGASTSRRTELHALSEDVFGYACAANLQGSDAMHRPPLVDWCGRLLRRLLGVMGATSVQVQTAELQASLTAIPGIPSIEATSHAVQLAKVLGAGEGKRRRRNRRRPGPRTASNARSAASATSRGRQRD